MGAGFNGGAGGLAATEAPPFSTAEGKLEDAEVSFDQFVVPRNQQDAFPACDVIETSVNWAHKSVDPDGSFTTLEPFDVSHEQPLEPVGLPSRVVNTSKPREGAISLPYQGSASIIQLDTAPESSAAVELHALPISAQDRFAAPAANDTTDLAASDAPPLAAGPSPPSVLTPTQPTRSTAPHKSRPIVFTTDTKLFGPSHSVPAASPVSKPRPPRAAAAHRSSSVSPHKLAAATRRPQASVRAPVPKVKIETEATKTEDRVFGSTNNVSAGKLRGKSRRVASEAEERVASNALVLLSKIKSEPMEDEPVLKKPKVERSVSHTTWNLVTN